MHQNHGAGTLTEMAAKKEQVYVIYGSDEGACSEAALKLFNQLNPPDADEFTNDIIDGNAENAEMAHSICSQTIQALQTLPFFGGNKIVWLKRATFMGSDRTGDSERANEGVEALKETLERGLGDNIIFILSATALDKRRSFFKWLNANAVISEINKIDTSRDGWQDQVKSLVLKRAKPFGLNFTEEALELFIMLAGEDSRLIKIELTKIDLYLGKDRRDVQLEDIRTLIPLSRQAVIFDIGKALQKREASRALALIDQQLAQGESAIAVIRASLIPTIRNLFMAKVASETTKLPLQNYNAYVAALQKLPEMETSWLPRNANGSINAYPLFLSAANAKNFTLAALKKAMESCHAADLSLVSTGLDHRMLLHRIVVELIDSKKP